ncbi:S1 RNA-binding domain-containing protein [Patescibacteria group bacterium]
MTNILDKIADEVDKIASKSTTTSSKKTAVNAETDTDNSVMGKLLAENPLEFPELGTVVEGKVIETTSSYILTDIGIFGTGIAFGKEAKDGMGGGKKIQIGDIVSAILIDTENEDGHLEISVREASHERAWGDIESKKAAEEIVETKILDANKGGLMVEVNGISGFLPVSQLSSEHYPRVEDGDKNKILDLLKKLVGEIIAVKIIDTHKEDEKLIVSEKAAISEKERAVISELKVGDVIDGEISGVVDFGAFVKFYPTAEAKEKNSNKLEGLVHISELAWQLIDNPKEIVKVGDSVQAKIIGIDDTRISLSVRALEKDPWGSVGETYKVGEIYEGTVDKINHFGVFVYLDKNIHGLAHVSEFQEVFPNKKMEDVLEVGEKYQWRVLSIEPKQHRMGLILVDENAKETKKEEVKEEKKEEKK